MAWRNYYGKGFYPQNSKYNSIKSSVDGIEFDSRKEAKRYEELKLMEAAGEIEDLELQKKFILIPAQREDDIVGKRGGVKKGKVIERECSYIADFVYRDRQSGNTIVEDTKSPATRTTEYIIKRKLMLYMHGIRISEI